MNKFRKWLRILHRDLGFLMIGLCIVYGISGILLNHVNGGDPAFKTEKRESKIEAGLTPSELEVVWNDHKDLPSLKRITKIDSTRFRLLLNKGVGVYHVKSGAIEYEKYSKRKFVYWINQLHYNKVKAWSPMADFFAGSLLFFALSGALIVKGKKGVMGRGKWLLIIGLLIPLLYVLLS